MKSPLWHSKCYVPLKDRVCERVFFLNGVNLSTTSVAPVVLTATYYCPTATLVRLGN